MQRPHQNPRLRTALWQGAKPRTLSKRSWMRTPRKTPMKAPARRGESAAQGPSSGASDTAVGHKPPKGWTPNSERNSERAGHSWIQLVFSLLFDKLGVPFARLPPPPAQIYSVRRQGEEADERVCGIPLDFLLPQGILRCPIPARRTRKA